MHNLEFRSSWLGGAVVAARHGRTVGQVRMRVVVVVQGSSGIREEPGIVKKSGALPSVDVAKRVVLVRHGESTWNEMGKIQGSSDYSRLTAKGESQAETSRQMLLSDSFDVCIYSPLARAKRTAEIIWGARRKEMIPLYDLREIDLYSFQGLMKDKGKEIYGEAYKMWQKDPVNFLLDGHYPVRELWARAEDCWSTILSQKGSSILVVAHNAVNQALVATATGLGSKHFRQLLQSNCGVSVLDFTPRSSGEGSPYVCLDRLNQTPSPPLNAGTGPKTLARIVLVRHGATDTSFKNLFASSDLEQMNMLGTIQSTKTAELLLDVEVDSLLCSPQPCAVKTAEVIAQVQEAKDCLVGSICEPRNMDVTVLQDLRDLNWGAWRGVAKDGVASGRWQDYLQHEAVPSAEKMDEFWGRTGQAWHSILQHLDTLQTESGNKTVVVVGHDVVHAAMLCHCLDLDQTHLGSFHLDTSSLSVIDFPDGALGKGIIRCINYTAHLGRWAVPVTRPARAEDEF